MTRLFVAVLATITTIATGSSLAASTLSIPLEAADPKQPIEVIADSTWSGAQVNANTAGMATLQLKPFKFDASKGAVTLVLDYAALRSGDQPGDAQVEVSIECPEAPRPCAVPIQDTMIGVRSQYMAEFDASVDGKPTRLWVTREAKRYRFDDKTMVSMWLSPKAQSGLDPQIIRARLVYGSYNTDPLPGQHTRGGALWNIVGVVLGGALLLLWWLRR